jgi:hypothetical protein
LISRAAAQNLQPRRFSTEGFRPFPFGDIVI